MNNKDSFVYEGRDLEAMSFAPRYHQWILDHFAPFVGQNIVEVGAGTGTFSEILLQRFNQEITMLEPSEEMIGQLKQCLANYPKYNPDKVHCGFTNELKLENQADTFFYVNVLEHIDHDEEELKWMHKNLQTDGHICIFVPALPWLYGSHDKKVDHFRRYTKRELVTKTERAGFNVQKAIYFDLPGVPLWWINFVLLKREMDPGAVHLYDRFIVPILSKLEPSSILPIGKNVLLVASK